MDPGRRGWVDEHEFGTGTVKPAVFLNEAGIVCSLGRGKREVAAGLFAEVPAGVTENRSLTGSVQQVGEVRADLSYDHGLPVHMRSRTTSLILTALAEIRPAVDQAVDRYGSTRVGIVLGTATSGMREAEAAMSEYVASGQVSPHFHLQQQELGTPALALSRVLGLAGPAVMISTACSSSAKALASAARLLQAGICDAVICGGADALCRLTVEGYTALNAVSGERCNPMSANRNGTNIGEGAALFLATREPGGVRLAGWGECSDAYHISAPEPGGRGAIAAMARAVTCAGIRPQDIDYVNLHGTATLQNDAMESLAVQTLLGGSVAASSTKPLTGHALGAAGAIDSAICWLTLVDERQRLPPHWWDGEQDPELPVLNLVQPGQTLRPAPRFVLNNVLAFGGSNIAVLLARDF